MFVEMQMDDQNLSNEDESVEKIGLGCALEHFAEWKEVLFMINNLRNCQESQDDDHSEVKNEKFKDILNLYKEQPHLLDPYIEQILNAVISLIRESGSMILKHRTFKYLSIIINVRGYKVVVRHLPHEVSDLEPVMKLLEEQDEKDTDTWETRYCLLLWLSIIVMIPFHLSRLDSGVQQVSVVNRLLDVIKKYLLVSDKCRDAAAFLSAKFLTRSDVKQTHMEPFFDWIASQCSPEGVEGWKKFGPLSSLASILKHGEREDLLPHAPKLLTFIMDAGGRNDGYRLTRKLAIKIVQRIGLTFLKVKIASWRYSRGSRTLAINLNSTGDHNQPNVNIANENKEDWSLTKTDSEETDVPAEIEDVIEELIQGLKNPDITIRWSAAKGIGRVTSRLNKDMGDEVVGSILDLLNPRESDSAWHGGCLALAELGKRGLLLPSRLPEVIPKVVKALVYDEPRGYSSVGSHIRDAACYVCWSFARAYDSDVIKPFVNELSCALLIVTCFDREIHCRRAASAAFQENVGRQGAFPHGIDILAAADYFNVGPRSNAYLNISVFIAQFEEYKYSLINHLVDRKVDHFDVAIRDLAGQALHRLTERAPQFMVDEILPRLIPKTNSIDLSVKHGSVIAIAEIIHALSKLNIAIGDETTIVIKDLIKNYKSKLLFHGLSSELMKLACCHLIEKCSLSKFPVDNSDVIDDWQALIDGCLCHEVNNIRMKAVAALSALCNQYYQENGVANQTVQAKLIDNYTRQLSALNHTARLGHAMALGALPLVMVKGCVDKVMVSLIQCTKITEISLQWAESRREAIKALTNIYNNVTLNEEIPAAEEPSISEEKLLSIFECFFEALNDYTQDTRGDVGSWVRMASMYGLKVLVESCTKSNRSSILKEDLVVRVIAGIGQQALERIDSIRMHAGSIFFSLIHCSPKVPNIPYHEKLLEFFPANEEIHWSAPHETFPRFVNMLSLVPYSYNMMLGFVASVGGLTESLVKYSSDSLFNYLKVQPDLELCRLGTIIVKIFEDHQSVSRVTLSLLSFLDRLFSSMTFADELMNYESDFAMKILNLTKNEIVHAASQTNKLTLSVNVFCQLIQVSGKVSQKALGQLCVFLCHKFSWLRQLTATSLYESLMVYGEECNLTDDTLMDALEILSSTEWKTWPLEKVRAQRNELCKIFKIQPPVVRTLQSKKKELME